VTRHTGCTTEDTVDRILVDRVYRPEAGGCSELPMDARINDVRTAGRQVIVVGGCGDGSASWQALSFDDDGLRRESTYRGAPFDYPTCGGIPRTSDAGGVLYDSHWIRQFEDATFVSSATSTGGTAPPVSGPPIICGRRRRWEMC